MSNSESDGPDLMPPPFSDGLDDWSSGDGTPESPTYDTAPNARLARGDGDFGVCLELRKTLPVQRLRYMGEVPVRHGAFLEVTAELKAVRGSRLAARIAAWPGGAGGEGVPDLVTAAGPVPLEDQEAPVTLSAVIGPEPRPGVDLVWDARVLYAHVGLDLIGPDVGVVRIAAVRVRDVSDRFAATAPSLPGFSPANRADAPVRDG